MGRRDWHPPEGATEEVMKEVLVTGHKSVLHWLHCPDCDEAGTAEAMLLCVGWTEGDLIAELLRRG